MLLNTDSPNAKTGVLIIGMENSHSEMNERLDGVSPDNPRGQSLEGKPLSTPSPTTLTKISRFCLTRPCHDTRMSSVDELRETSCESRTDRAGKCHLNAWNSTGDYWLQSNSLTIGDEHRTAREVYDRGKSNLTVATQAK